jgi:hypothetical protein
LQGYNSFRKRKEDILMSTTKEIKKDNGLEITINNNV